MGMGMGTTCTIWVRNGCPGSVTGVAWYGWARDWGARGHGFDSDRNPYLQVLISHDIG